MLKLLVGVLFFSFATITHAADPWLVFPGKDGAGKGKKILLVSGDEEYRSEECMPQLAKILSQHHGFDCTVLFAVDPKDGTINPDYNKNIPGLEALEKADLTILFIRMRELPEEQLKHIANYAKAGKPIIALRTSTHPFQYSKESPFHSDYDWKHESGGFGKKVFGETWVAHHGTHAKEGCRGVFAKGKESHPILKGVKDRELFGPSDVYRVKLPLPGDSEPIILGEVTKTLEPTSEAVAGSKNEPMMPICWTKSYTWDGGKKGKTFTSTMMCSQDFVNEGLRRVLINASFWCLGMEDKIPEKANVDFIGEYKPTQFKFKGFKTGVKPEDLK